MDRPPDFPPPPARVAVLGAGESGRAAVDLLRARGYEAVPCDEAATAVPAEQRCAPDPSTFDAGVVSPGFPPDHPWRQGWHGSLRGECALAAHCWPGRVLAVTGTNGKSTLVSLLTAALQAAGEKATACGNFGRAWSRVCLEEGEPDRWAVVEASSFQIHDWPAPAPEGALWTNFAVDHLDWHPDESHYFRSKARLVAGARHSWVGPGVAAAAQALGESLPEGVATVAEDPEDSPPPDSLFSRAPFRELYALARAWWGGTGRDPAALAAAARDFRGLPHRCEALGTLHGWAVINDSKATNGHAAVAAARAAEDPVLWIGGGSEKGEDPAAIAGALAPQISAAFCFGSTGGALAEGFAGAGVTATSAPDLGTLWPRVLAHLSGQPAGTILFSPGFASFDQYSSYAARGDHFRRLVRSAPDRAGQPGGMVLSVDDVNGTTVRESNT